MNLALVALIVVALYIVLGGWLLKHGVSHDKTKVNRYKKKEGGKWSH